MFAVNMKRKQSVWTQCMLRKVLFHPPWSRLSGSLAGWPDGNPETTHLSVVERRADVEMKWQREVTPVSRTFSVWFEWERPHPLMFEYLIRSSFGREQVWPCCRSCITGHGLCGLSLCALSVCCVWVRCGLCPILLPCLCSAAMDSSFLQLWV